MAGLTLNVDIVSLSGSKTPVLITHGLFGAGKNWGSIAKLLAVDRPVAVVDLRNHGTSPWSDAMNYLVMAEDLAKAARDTFGGPAILIGHSMGGKTAMATALLHESVVAGVAVIDIAPVDDDLTARQDAYSGYIAAMKSVDLSAILRRRDVEIALQKTVSSAGLRAFFAQNLILDSKDGPRWRLNLSVLDQSLPKLIGWPEELAEKQFIGPSFALYGGASDFVTRIGEAALKKHFPAIKLQSMDDAGHWLHAEKPKETAAALLGWLATN